MTSNQRTWSELPKRCWQTKRKRVGILGLIFKSGTDDLREKPLVQLVSGSSAKGARSKLLGPGCLTRSSSGSNRQFIEEEIPHIGALLSTDLEEVVRRAEVLVIGATSLDEEAILAHPPPGSARH